MRIMFVQYGGDFREAYQRLQATGTETYYGHKYVLDQLESLQNTFGETAIMCCLSPTRYEEKLPNGVTVMGAARHPKKEAAAVIRAIEAWKPTHLVVLGALTAFVRWASDNNVRVLCQCADSFNTNLILRFLKYGALGSVLNRPQIDFVANHGVNACRSLVRIGVDSRKVLPWDWEYTRRPDDLPPRTTRGPAAPSLLYVGTIQPKKGVGDAIAAIGELKRRGVTVGLKLAGGGKLDGFKQQAAALGVADQVEFLGVRSNAEVFELMRQATAVVVPSHHAYPEGLPLTIYESLCARTPIIASDHPMFAGHLRDRETAMVFPQKDVTALADAVSALLTDDALYHHLSVNGETAWLGMQNPVKWGEIIHRWVRNEPDDRQWLSSHTIAARDSAASAKVA